MLDLLAEILFLNMPTCLSAYPDSASDLLVVDALVCPGDPASVRTAAMITHLLKEVRQSSGACILLASRETLRSGRGWPSFWGSVLPVQGELSLATRTHELATQGMERRGGKLTEKKALEQRAVVALDRGMETLIRGTLRLHDGFAPGGVSATSVAFKIRARGIEWNLPSAG